MLPCGMRMALDAGVIMEMSVLVDMRHDAFVVHMDHAGPLIVVGQTIGCGMTAGQREGDRRGQHAKQIG